MSGDVSEMIGEEFNPQEHETAGRFDPIPPAWYPVEIENAEIVATRDGTGKRLKFTLVLIGESFTGRKLFPALNLVNKNPEAVKIAMRELASIGQALGLVAIKDSSELIGKQLQVKVVVKPAKDEYDAGNDVKGWKALEGSTPTQAATQKASAPKAAAPAAKPATAATVKRPWEKK